MNDLHVIMYHYVRDLAHSRYPGIKGLDVSAFRKQIEFVKQNFNIISMEQFLLSLDGGYKLPDRAMLLTFDDGYIDNYTFAMPLLEEFGLTGAFFIPAKAYSTHTLLDVNKIHYILASSDISRLVEDVKIQMDYYRGTEFDYPETDGLYEKYAVPNRWDNEDTIFVKRMLQAVLPEELRKIISSNLFEKYVGVTEEQMAYELYMTPEQIQTMKKHGMHIGVHCYDHYSFTNLTKEKIEQDISKALETLKEFIEPENWTFAYPYGNFNNDVINCIKAHGAVAGFTCEAKKTDISEINRYLIPRFDCNDFPPKSENYLML